MSARIMLRAAAISFLLTACASDENADEAAQRTQSVPACFDGADCASKAQALQSASPYLAFTLQTGTALHETDGSFEFLVAANRDLFAIKKRATGSGSTEVHVLSAASNYQRFSLQTGTGLHETGNDFEFALTATRDLVAIKKKNTGSHSTEVHILSARSNYQSFILQTGTGLHETGDDFEFEFGSNNDLYAIKKYGTGIYSTEVHVLSAASNYQRFSLQTRTPVPAADGTFSFLLSRNNDIYVIRKKTSVNGPTEVHVLSSASRYGSFTRQAPSALHQTGDDFAFALAQNLDIFAIKKYGTGTRSTEVHVLGH